MIDVTHLKVHRTASSLGTKKGGLGRLIGQAKGGPTIGSRRVGPVSDYIGASALITLIFWL